MLTVIDNSYDCPRALKGINVVFVDHSALSESKVGREQSGRGEGEVASLVHLVWITAQFSRSSI